MHSQNQDTCINLYLNVVGFGWASCNWVVYKIPLVFSFGLYDPKTLMKNSRQKKKKDKFNFF